MFSLSSVPLFIFLSQLCFFLFYVGLALSHFFALYVFCIALSFSLPRYSWNTFRRRRDRRRRKTEDEERQKTKKDRRRRRTEDEERQKKKKDKEKSRTKVDIEVNWWIADLRIDQLNRFRVNSKRDTLE